MTTDLLVPPQNHNPAAFGADVDCQDGVAIESIERGTALIVQTLRSTYRLFVLDGQRGLVLVQGGRMVPSATPAVLQGSRLGLLLMTGWIGVGRRMELTIAGRRLLTSRVRSVIVEQ